jgi:replication factor C subunit 2/4
MDRIAAAKVAQQPWIEMYRPETLDQMLLQKTTRQLLQSMIDSSAIRNLIISGPPGIGKTTTAQCLAHVIPVERRRDCITELNSSNDRGIKPIMALSDFCKKSVTYVDENRKTVSLQKIIVFDEADRILDKSQMAIVKLMSDFPNVAFIFTCNDSSLIIEAIQSSCTILRYLPIPRDVMTERLAGICDAHRAKYTKDGIKRAVLYSKGDMRRAINIAQSTWSGFGSISAENIQRLYPLPSFDRIEKILDMCRKGKLNDALGEVRSMQNEGTSAQDILSTIQTVLITNEAIDEKFRIMALEELGRALFALSMFQTQLQLEAYFARVCSHKLL